MTDSVGIDVGRTFTSAYRTGSADTRRRLPGASSAPAGLSMNGRRPPAGAGAQPVTAEAPPRRLSNHPLRGHAGRAPVASTCVGPGSVVNGPTAGRWQNRFDAQAITERRPQVAA